MNYSSTVQTAQMASALLLHKTSSSLVRNSNKAKAVKCHQLDAISFAIHKPAKTVMQAPQQHSVNVF